MSSAIEVLKSELKEFDDYCEYTRGDWSGFDGRQLLNNWNSLKSKIDEALLALEQKEKLKKKINSVLEYYECNPYNHKTGYKLGDEAREEVMEILNDLLKELEEGVEK